MTSRYFAFTPIAFKLLCLIVAALFFSSSRASGKAEDTSCNTNFIPGSILSLMKYSFVKWRIKNERDFDDSHRASWIKTKPGLCPGIAKGHFVNSQTEDYAILLVSKDHKKQSYKVVVFSPKGGKINSYLVESGQHFMERIAVSRIPPGTYSGTEDSPTVELKMDGIVVEAIEAGSMIYYWSNGSFKNIITSE